MYAMMWSRCAVAACDRLFAYNPHTVPSIRLNGERAAVCRECVEFGNHKRSGRGEEPHPIASDAYDPIAEDML